MTHYLSISDFLEAHGYEVETDYYVKKGSPYIFIYPYQWQGLSVEIFIEKAKREGWVKETNVGDCSTPPTRHAGGYDFIDSGRLKHRFADGTVKEWPKLLFSDEGRGRYRVPLNDLTKEEQETADKHFRVGKTYIRESLHGEEEIISTFQDHILSPELWKEFIALLAVGIDKLAVRALEVLGDHARNGAISVVEARVQAKLLIAEGIDREKARLQHQMAWGMPKEQTK